MLEQESHVRIGSLSWFAGVWWLALSVLTQALAWICLHIYLYRLSWAFINLAMKCNALAMRCAIEAGAKEE